MSEKILSLFLRHSNVEHSFPTILNVDLFFLQSSVYNIRSPRGTLGSPIGMDTRKDPEKVSPKKKQTVTVVVFEEGP